MNLVDSETLYSLLKNRYVLLCGDSVMRSIYKDIILLVQGENRLLTVDELKGKLDYSSMKSLNDQLLEGEKRGNDTTFYERRCYLTNFHLVKFVFLTRCLSGQMRNEIQEIAEGKSLIPDVLLMNSAIWDICKYGTNAEKDYASLLEECFCELRRVLPERTVVIWLTATPFCRNARAIFEQTRAERTDFLRLRIFEINRFSSELAKKFHFQVIDLHYFLRNRVQHRCEDGVHYDALIHREITTKIARSISLFIDQNLSNREEKLHVRLKPSVRRILRKKKQILPMFNSKENALLHLLRHYENN